MTLSTPLCSLLGIDYPIVQAPIGPAAGPELAAAVADAGGLGMLSVTWESPTDARELIDETRERTGGAFGVNLVLDTATAVVDPAEQVDTCIEAGVDVFSFAWGDAGPYADRVHDAGGVVLQTVGSAEEAQDAVTAGADIVVAQGWEAGGHVQSGVATLPLVPQITDAVDVPVVSAGGIADGRGIAAVLTLGADGAWLGTRFVVTEEARTHEAYREAVAEAAETDTLRSELFDRGWAGATHRVVENSTVDEWNAAGRPGPGDRPGEDEPVVELPDGTSLPRYTTMLPTPGMTGNPEALALYAGQSAGGVKEVRSARMVVADLVAETEAAIRRTGELL